jgi:hypothetical protein
MILFELIDPRSLQHPVRQRLKVLARGRSSFAYWQGDGQYIMKYPLLCSDQFFSLVLYSELSVQIPAVSFTKKAPRKLPTLFGGRFCISTLVFSIEGSAADL